MLIKETVSMTQSERIAAANSNNRYLQSQIDKSASGNNPDFVKANFANALKGYASGSVVRLDDVSPIDHPLNMEVTMSDNTSCTAGLVLKKYGKNLLKYPYSSLPAGKGSVEINGVTFTVLSGGKVKAKGTATADAQFFFRSGSAIEKQVLQAGTYYMSGCPKGGSTSTYFVGGFSYNDTGEGFECTLKTQTADWFYIKIVAGTTVDNLIFEPQIEVGSTRTEFEPYKEPVSYTLNGESYIENIDGISSESPVTTLVLQGVDATMKVEYNKDINKVNFGDGGSGASVTSTSIKNALGYTPADEEEVDELSINKVDVEKPIDSSWEKWADVRYNYGFNKSLQPIFNTVNGVLESDTMISVRGGKGRWNKTDVPSSEFVSGGHVFEGWSGEELARLTMLMGKFHETFACIQTYSPAGLYEDARRFGWVKLGSDDKFQGVDFTTKWTTCYTPITLNPQNTPTEVTNWDLNPQFKSKDIPVGTMYFDANAQRIKVYTNTGWRVMAFVGETSNGGNDGSGELITPIPAYRTGYMVAVESGKIVQDPNSNVGRIGYFMLNPNTTYTITRSARSPRFRVYLYYSASVADAMEIDEAGYLTVQDENNTALDSLTFTNADYNMAVVMLDNTDQYTQTTFTVEMEE